MRNMVGELDNIDLLEKYTLVSRNIEIIILKNAYQELKEFEPDDIPILMQDKYAGMYAEILSRMGESEEEIAIALKNNPLLRYENGNERIFTKIYDVETE